MYIKWINNYQIYTFFTQNTCFLRFWQRGDSRVAVISAKNHERQHRKRQSVTAKREKSQTPKVLAAIVTLPNLT